MSDSLQDEKLGQSLDRWPSPTTTAVLSFQWLVVLVPSMLVVGDLVALAWGLDSAGRVAFQQRLFVVMGAVQLAQVFFGHRLPGVAGPSTVLLVGVLSTVASGPGPVYGAMVCGGVLMALLGLSGLAARLGRLYTPPVLASTLLLIAVNLVPAMRDMIFDRAAAGQHYAASFLFAMALACVTLWAQSRFKGLLGSSMLMIGMAVGSLVYYLIGLAPWPTLPTSLGAQLTLAAFAGPSLEFNLPVTLAFLVCYLALISNELGTLQTLGHMLMLKDMDRRVARSVTVEGFGCVAAGLLGSVGPVTYSVSPGVVLASANASRWTLLPAALATLLLALWPQGMGLFQLVPPPVAGAVLFSLMAFTVFAAMAVLTSGDGAISRRSGLVVGAAMIAGVIISFMPPEAKQALHPYLRPVLGNGFVAGLLLALILDRFLPRQGAS